MILEEDYILEILVITQLHLLSKTLKLRFCFFFFFFFFCMAKKRINIS
jgi:hypothetical protein